MQPQEGVESLMSEKIGLYSIRAQYFPIITALLHHENRFLQVGRASIVHFSGKMVLLQVSGE